MSADNPASVKRPRTGAEAEADAVLIAAGAVVVAGLVALGAVVRAVTRRRRR